MLQKILACATFAPLLLACSPFAQALPAIPQEQASLVDSTCARVMGLRQGEYQFSLCRESLTRAVAARMEGQDMAAAYRDCRQHGLAEGTAGFSTCMLDSKAGAPRPQATAIAYGGEAGKSFFDVTPRAQFQRERYACAQLGLLPGSGAFGQCVASLQAGLTANTD